MQISLLSATHTIWWMCSNWWHAWFNLAFNACPNVVYAVSFYNLCILHSLILFCRNCVLYFRKKQLIRFNLNRKLLKYKKNGLKKFKHAHKELSHHSASVPFIAGASFIVCGISSGWLSNNIISMCSLAWAWKNMIIRYRS